MKIELNVNESQVLRQLLDAAVRHLGSPAAEAVGLFDRRIAEAQALDTKKPIK